MTVWPQVFLTVVFCTDHRKADDGLQKVSQVSEAEHVMPRDISNKHIMAYGKHKEVGWDLVSLLLL